ncbi:MAG: hypothetical protein AB7E73_17510 [Burkholderiales bacterium]
MMLDDAIRTAESGDQIVALLAAYIDNLQSGENDPAAETRLPLTDMDELRARFRRLILGFDSVSTRAGDKGPLIKEALYVYETALYRLQALEARNEPPAGRPPVPAKTGGSNRVAVEA